ncbi:MAG: hypothetical protein HY472_01380 [Candidatus Sungbacteria bacterium]|nr:hypothetical protein [Candidatus Sungbacteria bacterium]
MDLLQITEKSRDLSDDAFEIFTQLNPLLENAKKARDDAFKRGTVFGSLFPVVYGIFCLGYFVVLAFAETGGQKLEGLVTIFVLMIVGFALTGAVALWVPHVVLRHNKNYRTRIHYLRSFCSKHTGTPLLEAIMHIKECNPNSFKVGQETHSF